MIDIRRYKPGEEDTLRQICSDTSQHINVQEYGVALVAKWCAGLESRSDWAARVERRNPFVADVDGELVGFAELTEAGSISAFYSHYLWQGKGAGKSLLKVLEAEARKQMIETLRVDSSISASQFFAKQGFEVIEEKVTLTDGIASRSLLMQKRVG